MTDMTGLPMNAHAGAYKKLWEYPSYPSYPGLSRYRAHDSTNQPNPQGEPS